MSQLSSYKSKQMIVMRRDLRMRKGKIAAQAGHACVEATLAALVREGRLDQVRATDDGWVYLDDAGSEAGVAKVCVYVDSEEDLLDVAAQAREKGFVYSLIRDAGLTEFHGEPTYTCLAIEPLPADVIDPITGSLPPY